MDTQQSMREMSEIERRYDRREGKIKRTKVAVEEYKARLLERTLVSAQELPTMVRQEVALLDYVDRQEKDLEARQQEFRVRQENFVAAQEAWCQQVQTHQEERERRVREEQEEYSDPFE